MEPQKEVVTVVESPDSEMVAAVVESQKEAMVVNP